MTKENELTSEILIEARKYSSATLHEAAGKTGNLPFSIKPLDSKFKLCGTALTVFSPPRDNLWIHKAIYASKPGDVLVIDVGGDYEAGYWGEILAHAAMQKKIAGLVIDGCVRDCERMIEMNFPVFSRGTCIRGTAKSKEAHGMINSPIRIGEFNINAGDLVFGDADGVVVVPKEKVIETLQMAEAREKEEARVIEEIRNGKRTLDIFNL